jgi:mono/diheme cytochrome c family protein
MSKHYKTIRVAFASALTGLVIAGLTSCGKRDENSPGVEYMPDMYRSNSLEYYQTHTVDGVTEMNAMQPVKGTVARGYLPYLYDNTPEGYEKAGANLKNPLTAKSRAEYEKEGEVIYGKFCIQCHGASGGGDGKVGLKLPGPPPAYSGPLKNLPEGKIFHTITYGKGLMGSHASQLTQEERWKLVYYVQKLQGHGSDAAPAADSTAAKASAEKGKAPAEGKKEEKKTEAKGGK